MKCLNIFATGCLSTVTMCRDAVLFSIGLVLNVVMSIEEEFPKNRVA